jgi:hypothetical protein
VPERVLREVAVVNGEVVAMLLVMVAEAEAVVDTVEGMDEELDCAPAAAPMYCWPSGLIIPDGSMRAVS